MMEDQHHTGLAEMQRVIAAKEERRRRLAALSYPEKVKIVVELQRMAAPIWRSRGHDVSPWDLESREG